MVLDFGSITKNTWEIGKYERNSNYQDIMKIIKRIIYYEDNFYIRTKLTNKIISSIQIKNKFIEYYQKYYRMEILK